MTRLELKMPPVIQVLIAAGLMQVIDHVVHYGQFVLPYRSVVSMAFSLIALGLLISSLYFFKKHKTTVDPVHLEKSNCLITQGVFKRTRNPIYLAFLCVLLGYCYFLGQVFNLIVINIFIAYMNRYQIQPEERFLLKRYGKQYADYMQHTRRWF